MSEQKREWLIRDGHTGYWWRPGGKGYTGDLTQAGLFTESEAKRQESPAYADRRDKAVHMSEVARPVAESELLDALRVGWQPIETAPKDGTWIVVVGAISGGQGHFRGYPRSCVTRWYGPDDFEDSPAYVPGWFYSSPGYGSLIHPTHWQPLPTDWKTLSESGPKTSSENRKDISDAGAA